MCATSSIARGTFDLKDYLIAEDGSALDGLPSFKFTGDPALSKKLDTRIQETEETRVDVGGHYYETLAVLGVLWIVWLLLLIFYGRAKPPPPCRGRASRADARGDAPRLPRATRGRHARRRCQGENGDASPPPLARGTRTGPMRR